MASFQCQTCGEPFELDSATLARYPGWKPRFCRKHSQSKGKGGSASARSSKRGPSKPRSRMREEHLTLAEVRKRYDGGPQTGLFTDGSAIPNPGRGGWGVVWVEEGEVCEQRHGRDERTTNNRMELVALIEAFRLLPEDASATVYTDSRLCVDTITKWAPGWERKGWKKKGGEIKNLELVQELLELSRAHADCELQWIAAHSGNLWNEYADSLATAWARDEL